MYKPFILASSSPRRLELLKQVQLVPEQVFAPEIDESIKKNELPRVYCERVANLKADAAVLNYPDKIIIACDTAVHAGRRILPKAETTEQAEECLEMLSGRRHRVLSCVVVASGKERRSRTVETIVQFRRIPDNEIEFYIQTEQWRGKAGGYSIQGYAGCFVKSINGSYTAVVGLPLNETIGLLKSF